MFVIVVSFRPAAIETDIHLKPGGLMAGQPEVKTKVSYMFYGMHYSIIYIVPVST